MVLITLGFYAIYLDSSLTKRFASERYQASAIVYARPLTFEPTAPLRLSQVLAELQQLRYLETSNLAQSGTYRRNGNQLEIHRRPFDFASGPEMAQRVRVSFANGRVSGVVSLPDGRPLNRFQLDPLVLGQVTGDRGRSLIGGPGAGP